MDVLLAELAVIAVMTLIVGTFSPMLQEKLPWGRAYLRWRNERMNACMRALEAAARPPAPEPEREGAGYRDAARRVGAPRVRVGVLEARRRERAAREQLEMENELEESLSHQSSGHDS